MGKFYEEGYIEQDKEKAYEYYKKGADLGDQDCIEKLKTFKTL